MTTRFVMASGTLEMSRDGKVVASGKFVDYEEVDGWVASEREGGAWTVWTRSDGFRVSDCGSGQRPWFVRKPDGWALNIGGANPGKPRMWKTAEAARRAIDREFPVLALAAGGGR